MIETLEKGYEKFDISVEDLKSATSISRPEKIQKLLSQVNVLSKSTDGLRYLYERSLEIEEAGFFADTAWNDPGKLSPALVKGTLAAGYPTTDCEILSELRMLAYAKGRAGEQSRISPKNAEDFLEEVLVHNLEFAFQELTEEMRLAMEPQEIQKVYNLFNFLLEESNLEGIKKKLADELQLICEQRPVVTRKVREIIQLINEKFDLDPSNVVDKRLLYYVNAVISPSSLTKDYPDPEEYSKAIVKLNDQELIAEIEQLAGFMKSTGLASPYLAALLIHISNTKPELVPKVLSLNSRGEAEFGKHKDLIIKLINEVISINCFQSIYGLARVLEKSLLSRKAVRASINNLRNVSINPQVEESILKCQAKPSEKVSAKQYLLSATLRVLGQPLGVGQGNNATCQSARGISMWSQHAPAKLLDMILTVAAQNNLIIRFENADLESTKLGKGLVDKLDFNLDAVSAVLVPHLDKIYNEMMLRASARGEDPHKWVNPALYGHWIQVGFASAYSYVTNSIQDFDGFMRLFYAAFHPEYNGGRQMVYPNPLGIFVTSRTGAMLGFHAISLLHVGEDKDGNMRAYFLNPNNEGRQNWGQGIEPSVYGHGEKHGESSLLFDQLAARVYAFHHNSLETKVRIGAVPTEKIKSIEALARASWGEAYIWSEFKKQW